MEDETEETVCCSACLAEPCDGDDGPDLNGWDQENEHGLLCPECVIEFRGPKEGDTGLDEFAEAVGAEKVEQDSEPYGIEFSAQIHPNETMGGCVDYDGPIPTEPHVPEQPKPDTGVRMTKTGNKEKP